MKTPHHQFGQTAEMLAQQYLREKGFRILERNVRLPGGELDIIARHSDTLVFVEVKARRTAKFGGASYAINGRKEQRLIKLAAQYLALRSHSDYPDHQPCRFDVILCQRVSNGSLEIQHIENALEVSGRDLQW